MRKLATPRIIFFSLLAIAYLAVFAMSFKIDDVHFMVPALSVAGFVESVVIIITEAMDGIYSGGPK